MLTFLVEPGDAGARLDALVAKRAGVSRARAAELVAAGAVSVGGRVQGKASYRVAEGDRVEAAPAEAIDLPQVDAPAVDVVLEDEHLLVVDKPSGLVVHAAPGHRGPTLVDALRGMGRTLAGGAPDRLGIVHRLDREVSGLLVVAKTAAAWEKLSEAMKARHVRRVYLACVSGLPSVDAGRVEAPIGRHPRQRSRMTVLPEGRPSVTHFHVLERFADAALLQVRLETGRTHQIRVHLDSIGHPILGDGVYGGRYGRGERGPSRPFLHAGSLGFEHPVSGEPVEASSPLPADLAAALDSLRGRA